MTDQLQSCGCKFKNERDDISGKMVCTQTVWCTQHKPPPKPAPPTPKDQHVRAEVAKGIAGTAKK